MIRNLLTCLICLASLLSLGAALVRADDQLEERQKRQKIAAQALEQDIKSAVDEAKRLKNDPAKAVKVLEEALAKLQPDDPLEITKRAELRVLIEGTIKEIKSPKQEKPSFLDRLPPTSAEVDKKVKAEFETILRLQKEGRSAEAQALTNKLMVEHPGVVSFELTKNTLAMSDTVRDDKASVNAKNKGSNDQMASLQKSATPISGDIQYDPKVWATAQGRKDKLEQQMNPRTALERKLIALLAQRTRVPISFKDLPLDKALDYIQSELGITLIIRKGTLDELRLDSSRTVSVTAAAGTSKNNVLEAMLSDLGLTIIIKNEQIMAVSKEEAANTLVTRVIPVDTLIGGAGGALTPDQLIKTLEDLTGPDNWKRNGGPGTITYYPAARVLIVRNTSPVISILEKKGY